jgi:hypothetical protein
LVFKPIFVAPSDGVTDTTEGGVVSGVAAVVKVLKKLFAVFPARSDREDEETTRTVKLVLPGSGDNGVKVTAVPALFTENTPARTPLNELEVSVIFELLTVEKSIPSLNVNVIEAFTDTPVAPFVGLTETTEGFVVSAVPELPVVNVVVRGVIAFPD